VMRRSPKIVALLARRDETAARKTSELTRNAMWQQDAYRMIQRRVADAGHQDAHWQPHLPRDWHYPYLKNKDTLEAAQHIANHESPCTTKLYDRRAEGISLDEVEKISIYRIRG